MFKEISLNEFEEEFREYNRANNFSYEGKEALFYYLEEIEESCDTKIELDIIALCCEYTEYEDINEYLDNYDTDIEKEDYEDIEDFNKAVMEELNDKTTVIMIDDESFIIQDYWGGINERL